MSKYPKIYGFCDAGCKWETVHKEDFEKSASIITCRKEVDGFHLEPHKTYRIKKLTTLTSSSYGFGVVFTCTHNGASHSVGIYNPSEVTLYDKDGLAFGLNASYREYMTIQLYTVKTSGNGFDAVFMIDGEYLTANITPDGATSSDTIENAQLLITGELVEECYVINEYASIKAEGVFIRYSAHSDGTDFTETWSEGQSYIGIAVGTNVPTDKSEYTWSFFAQNAVIPTFDLVALGMGNIVVGGGKTFFETDTTEMTAALAIGMTRFKVALEQGGLIITASFDMHGIEYGLCSYSFEFFEGCPMILNLLFTESKVTGYVTKLWSERVKAIDLTAFDTNGKIVETYADGSTKTTTMEFDENGNPIKITDGDGNVTELTW